MILSPKLFAQVADCSLGAAEIWHDDVGRAMREFDIKTPRQMAMFIAQCSHESGHFRRIEENLNYAASALPRIWPRHFSRIDGNKYGRTRCQRANKEMIANIAYANRMGNGDIDSGDGYRYRGRGIIQLTGKNNYRDCGSGLDLDLLNNPDLLLQPEYAALSAAWFWVQNGLNPLAGQDKIITVTKRINGGTNGLADRKHLYANAKEVLSA